MTNTGTGKDYVPMINEPLVRQTMQAIADDLDGWNQNFYIYDNADGIRQFCFGGRALVLQGYTVAPLPDPFYGQSFLRLWDTHGKMIVNTMDEASAELGFTENQACRIMSWTPGASDLRTKEEQFAEFAEYVLTWTGIDCR